MSKPEPEYWMIELGVDHANQLYAVQRIDRTQSFTYTPPYYVQVQALDEIGAFSEAQKILNRIGFRNGVI